MNGSQQRPKVLVVLLSLILLCRPLDAQQTFCYPLDSDSLHTVYIDNVRKLASDRDTAYAATGIAIGYPRVRKDSISLIRDERVCREGAQAFAANVPSRAVQPPSGKVFVVRVGSSHYYVADPEYHVTPNFTYFILFTSSWKLVFRHGH